MTIRPAYRELSYPLPMKGGNILRTIPDARAYMLTLGPHRSYAIIGGTPVNSSWKRPMWRSLRGNFTERFSWMECST